MASEFIEKGFGKSWGWMDLANSLEWDGFGVATDLLPRRDWMEVFLRHCHLPPSLAIHPPLARLKAVRAFLRHLAETLASGSPPSSRDVSRLNLLLGVPVRRALRCHRDGFSLDLETPQRQRTGWDWAIAEIVAPLAAMLAEGQSDRVKICSNCGCRWIFFDRTRGKTRRWCNDRTCGNRERVRKSRAANR